jgi:hypothetical protein
VGGLDKKRNSAVALVHFHGDCLFSACASEVTAPRRDLRTSQMPLRAFAYCMKEEGRKMMVAANSSPPRWKCSKLQVQCLHHRQSSRSLEEIRPRLHLCRRPVLMLALRFRERRPLRWPWRSPECQSQWPARMVEALYLHLLDRSCPTDCPRSRMRLRHRWLCHSLGRQS